jgi:hypothetical protein
MFRQAGSLRNLSLPSNVISAQHTNRSHWGFCGHVYICHLNLGAVVSQCLLILVKHGLGAPPPSGENAKFRWRLEKITRNFKKITRNFKNPLRVILRVRTARVLTKKYHALQHVTSPYHASPPLTPTHPLQPKIHCFQENYLRKAIKYSKK